MTNPRDTQFAEWAKLLYEEIYDDFRGLNLDYDDGNEQGVKERRKEIEKVLSRRTYDLAQFIISQEYKDELKPKEILYRDGKPVKVYPENLKEWFEKNE